MQLLKEITCGLPVQLLLLSVGIYYTFKLKFFQIKKFGKVLKSVFGKDEKSGISSRQSLFVALGGSLGIGNIAGVATAMSIGGAGTVFWMWISGILGMMTKYAETVLAVHYRKKNSDSTFSGGPMYYIEKGMNCKFLAVIFALAGALASFGVGNITQANSVAEAMKQTFFIPPFLTGILLFLICITVLLGGAKKIALVMEQLVPYMTLFYITGCMFILVTHSSFIWGAFKKIITEAFCGNSLLGAGAGIALKEGISKGLFSNEAGMGSTAIAYASSSEKDPVKQGMMGIFEVFADTIFVCTLTALTLIVTDSFALGGMSGAINAFESVMPAFGGCFIAVSSVLFAFASTLAWSYYGRVCSEYLFGKGSGKIYNFLFSFALIPGAIFEISVAWDIADILNGFMMIPNLFALIILSKKVVSVTKNSLYI